MGERLRGLLKLFNSQDHTAEVNLVAYAAGILAGIVWLSIWFHQGPRDANLVAAFAAFLTAITGGLVLKKGSNAPAPPAPAGTQDKEGRTA